MQWVLLTGDVMLGRGVDTNSYHWYGLDPADTVAIAEERYELIRRLWTEENLDWEGRFRDPLDNFTLRPELYYDPQGQRTGTPATYYSFSLGWQHFFSPQLEMRPEIGYYRSIDAKAFNGDSNAGIAPDKNYTAIGQMDAIFHF